MNQREIKFRAWTDQGTHGRFRMQYNVGIMPTQSIEWHENPYGLFLTPGTRHVLMQFTGFNDNHGREIYEGDIVETTDEVFDTGRSLWQVKWDQLEEMTGWIASTKGKDYPFDSSICSGEIIGNIYENPELISPEKVETNHQ